MPTPVPANAGFNSPPRQKGVKKRLSLGNSPVTLGANAGGKVASKSFYLDTVNGSSERERRDNRLRWGNGALPMSVRILRWPADANDSQAVSQRGKPWQTTS